MKARIHQNVWGNWNGYLGRRRVAEFGTDEPEARVWLGDQGEQADSTKREWKRARARHLIERRDKLCFDVCAEHSQIFDNVKHMKWLVEAVADEL